MKKFIPTKMRDLTKSKQQVMQNVVNDIENNSKRPKHQWRFVAVSFVLLVSTPLFFFNIENELPSNKLQAPIEHHLDLAKPIFTDEQGTIFLQGITLGDSHKKVKGVLGENYTIVQEDDSEADLIMDYGGQSRFYFDDDKLNSAVFMNVDKKYFNQVFKDYDGFKFFTSIYTDYDGHYFYSNETKQIIEAITGTSEGKFQLSLSYNDPNYLNAEYLYRIEKKLNNQRHSPSSIKIDLVNPTIFEEQGHLHLNGVTLGDSSSEVIERFGNNYLIGRVDGGGSDFVLDYGKQASFSFYEDKLISVALTKVDKDYFDQLFNGYEGFKFVSASSEDDKDCFIYSKKTNNIIKATTQTPNQELHLYLSNADPSLYEIPNFLEAMEQYPD
ncbi:hypothetical protein [Psychrobacillus sp. BL-248-WT-3]|uniref:hypothetical protein n=1 Tax=Psychrobacillus sp. BL-248-WT-3 TaxID=2725306 RepID=UPI00146DB13E|nr:hypothetical protein [Psychrobacillus sp. BL-248-WT-3]NME05273.1 hypothetical protein [Psychrobacillus sp. BL-248-WT-3]